MPEGKKLKTTRKLVSRTYNNPPAQPAIAPAATGVGAGLIGGALGGRTAAAAQTATQGPFQKVKRVGSSIAAVPFGILVLIAGLVLIYVSVVSVKESSKLVEELSIKKPSEVKDNETLVMFKGTPTVTEAADYTYKNCVDVSCKEAKPGTQAVSNLLYYSAKIERYEQVEETSTETQETEINGEEATDEYEVTEISEEWVHKTTSEEWSEFKIGDIKISPDDAKTYLDTSEQTLSQVYFQEYADAATIVSGGEDVASGKLGENRVILTSYPADEEVTVIGKVSGGEVSTGEPFIITDMTKSEIVTKLGGEETTQRWIWRVISWILLTIGIMMVLGPILSILDFIPVVGRAANTMAFFAGAVISAIIVFVGTIVVKYWWIVLIGFAVLIIAGIAVIILAMGKKGEPGNVENQEASQ